MKTRKRIKHDAGVSFEPKFEMQELNDQGGHGSIDVPASPYAIRETVDLVFTNKFVEGVGSRLSIADGDVRPGTTK